MKCGLRIVWANCTVVMVAKCAIIVSSIQSVEILLSQNDFLSSRVVTKMGSLVLIQSLMFVDFSIAS